MKATAKRLVNQQQPPMFWIMNDPRYHHRFPTDRHSQIVPAALFKMLKTRDHAGQAANLRARCEIYVSRWRHKSCTGNEKRRVASPPRYPSENWNGCAHCNPFNLKVETIYGTIGIIYITFSLLTVCRLPKMMKICIKFVRNILLWYILVLY